MIEDNDKEYWVWFSLINNLGLKRKKILIDKYRTPKRIYELKKFELIQNKGIGDKIIKEILNEETREKAKQHYMYMEKNNMDIINITDKDYPNGLKEIYDPPISIYIKGNIEALNNIGIAIVGCRNASEYGKKAAKYFAYNLTKEGYNIISGLAKGIDSFSHIGNIHAINENNINRNIRDIGKTIAVIGSGLDEIYPKENTKLFEEIIKSGGIIISEYPLGTKPFKMNFPARNRIISGLAKGIIVVEAKEKSGTLITVDFALEQGKDVYVVPGNIDEINSIGTNNLIKQGAAIVTNYRDVLNNIKY